MLPAQVPQKKKPEHKCDKCTYCKKSLDFKGPLSGNPKKDKIYEQWDSTITGVQQALQFCIPHLKRKAEGEDAASSKKKRSA